MLILGVRPWRGGFYGSLNVDLAVLYVGATDARVTSLKPSNPSEEAELAPLVFAIAGFLKTGPGPISVSAGLHEYITEEQAKEGHPLAVTGNMGTFAGEALPARLYRSSGEPFGDAYVVVEEAPDGQIVSVFPVLATLASTTLAPTVVSP